LNQNVSITLLDPEFEIVSGTREHLNVRIEARVQEIWSGLCRQRGADLFDGEIFSVTHSASKILSGCFQPYRLFAAQLSEPSLYPQLKIHPLAVTGVLVCGDGLVIGQRSSQVLQNKGEWEFVPSGGIDHSALSDDRRVDWSVQLEREVAEELGLSPIQYEIGEPVCLIHDESSKVFDLFVLLRTTASIEDLKACHDQAIDKEHQQISLLDPSFSTVPLNKFAASSRALLSSQRLQSLQVWPDTSVS